MMLTVCARLSAQRLAMRCRDDWMKLEQSRADADSRQCLSVIQGAAVVFVKVVGTIYGRSLHKRRVVRYE